MELGSHPFVPNRFIKLQVVPLLPSRCKCRKAASERFAALNSIRGK